MSAVFPHRHQKKVDGNYVLEAELPGFKKEDINIDIDKDCSTIFRGAQVRGKGKTRATTVLYAASVITDRSAAASILKVLDTDGITAEYNDEAS